MSAFQKNTATTDAMFLPYHAMICLYNTMNTKQCNTFFCAMKSKIHSNINQKENTRHKEESKKHPKINQKTLKNKTDIYNNQSFITDLCRKVRGAETVRSQTETKSQDPRMQTTDHSSRDVDSNYRS